MLVGALLRFEVALPGFFFLSDVATKLFCEGLDVKRLVYAWLLDEFIVALVDHGSDGTVAGNLRRHGIERFGWLDIHRRSRVDSCLGLGWLQLKDLRICLNCYQLRRHLVADENVWGQCSVCRIRVLDLRLQFEVRHLFLQITVFFANFVQLQTISIIRAMK